MCILLYDDRIRNYQRLKDIDNLIDDDTSLVQEFVDADVKNQLAHKELQSFNDTGKFVNKHPIVIQFKSDNKQYDFLQDLKKNNPQDFLLEITNTIQNIRRIESDLNKKKYKDDKQRQSWIENLEKAIIKRNLLARTISQ